MEQKHPSIHDAIEKFTDKLTNKQIKDFLISVERHLTTNHFWSYVLISLSNDKVTTCRYTDKETRTTTTPDLPLVLIKYASPYERDKNDPNNYAHIAHIYNYIDKQKQKFYYIEPSSDDDPKHESSNE